ncbi:Putative protein of unknown function [Podospora comata]|uniref:Uncharacterized protein n=1 Tax=Podospora comata TaxID=48703 RepID=A0ABY6RU69_PODCO|nr:Putative protein of unknown function [Podospora comata]
MDPRYVALFIYFDTCVPSIEGPDGFAVTMTYPFGISLANPQLGGRYETEDEETSPQAQVTERQAVFPTDELGSRGRKRSYTLAHQDDQQPAPILPGHLEGFLHNEEEYARLTKRGRYEFARSGKEPRFEDIMANLDDFMASLEDHLPEPQTTENRYTPAICPCGVEY